MEPERQGSPGIKKPLLVVALLLLIIPLLILLSRVPAKQDGDERKSVRDQAAAACADLANASAGLSEVAAAVQAFEEDKQLVLSVAARQAESEVRGGLQTPDTIEGLADDCRAVYGSSR